MEQEVVDSILQARGRKTAEAQQLNRMASKKYLKEKLISPAAAQRVIDALDFTVDGKAFVLILLRAFELAENLEAQSQLCSVTARLLLEFDWSRDYLEKPPVQFLELVRTFTDVCVHTNCAYEALHPVESVMKKKRALSSFTSIHADFLLLCLVSKQYTYAKQRLEIPIRQVCRSEKSLNTTPLDLMKYYYYGGRIYAGLKEFQKALQFFKMCIALPALGPSLIVAEAFKFYLILSLMVEGKVDKYPKHTSTAVQRLRNPEEYTAFAQKYQERDLDGVVQVLKEKGSRFDADGTFGLAKQSLKFLRKRIVKQQTYTFLTVALDDIAAATKLHKNEAESLLFEMIACGEIHALVDQEKGTVEFKEYSGGNRVEQLDEQLQNLRLEVSVLQNIEHDVSTSKNYMKKVTQWNSSNVTQQTGGAVDMMETSAF